jgi:hypothetical protein
MTCMSEAASENRRQGQDSPKLTDHASKRIDAEDTAISSMVPDDQAGVAGPEGDDAGEDKVETSLSDDW